MKVGRQIWIDRYVGLPMGYLLNLIVRLAGKVLFINHRLDRDFKRIAVVKFKGMGSIVQCQPMLLTLKKNYPNAELVFITSKANKGIIDAIGMVNSAIYLDDSSFLRLLFNGPVFVIRLMLKRFQLLFDLEVYSNLSSIMCTLSCATNRFGYFLSASQYRMGLYTNMAFFNTRVPLSMTYLQMVRQLPLDEVVEEASPIKAEGAKMEGLKDPYILINPNASELRIERRWSKENFALLIDEVQEKYPEHQVVLIGGKAEKEYVDALCDLLRKGPQSVLNVAGQTDMQGLISLIAHCTLFVSSDTGPAHLAYNQKKPSIVLYGPVNPIQFSIPDNAIVIYKNLYCSPCVHEFDIPPCQGDNQCMKSIKLEEVLEAVDKMLKGSSEKGGHEKIRYTDDRGKALGSVGR